MSEDSVGCVETLRLLASRRRWLRSVVGIGLSAVAVETAAHTPYKQWTVYRRKHLLLGCHKDAPATYDIAKDLAATLKVHLPDARARVARAPSAQRLASLMATDQLDSAVLTQSVALRMAAGKCTFSVAAKSFAIS